MDVTQCRGLMKKLQAEREKCSELTERLQEKLKALNNELAARREEAERCKNSLEEEQLKNRRQEKRRREGLAADEEDNTLALPEDKSLQDHQEAAATRKEGCLSLVEEALQTQLAKVPRSETGQLGLKEFDEMELMVKKSLVDQHKENVNIDTVLITYNVPNSEQQHYLSYRVEHEMKVKQLREDACKYWGISEVEFVLKTMANSKVVDSMKIQDCFEPTEEARLVLAQKNPKQKSILSMEEQNIAPKGGPAARKHKAKVSENVGLATEGQAEGDLVTQIQELHGLWEFMTQRDRNLVQHLKRIQLRTLLATLALAIATLVSFYMIEPPTQAFFLQRGLMDALQRDGKILFDDITSQSQMWEWLEQTLPARLFSNSSQLRNENYFLGYLQVSMQQVGNASSANCVQLTGLPSGVTCLPVYYSTATAGTDEIAAVKNYWTNVSGKGGRFPDFNPGQYRGTADMKVYGLVAESGMVQSYDESGYSLAYDLQHQPLSDVAVAWEKDMSFLKNHGWVNPRTRRVTVTLGSYNANYDKWCSVWFHLELPATGAVWPSGRVKIFLPAVFEGSVGQDQIILDAIRLVLALYMGCYQAYTEAKQEREKTGTLWNYFLSVKGLADLLIGTMMLAIFIQRFFVLKLKGSSNNYRNDMSQGFFLSVQAAAKSYWELSCAEAILFAIIVLRLTFLLRINRHFFVLWTTLQRALKAYARYTLVFLPIMIGFVITSHSMWCSVELEQRSFFGSLTSVIMLLYSTDGLSQINIERPWMVVYLAGFYVASKLVLINCWIGVFVGVYQQTRVEAGYQPSDYAWTRSQYINWACWRRIRDLILGKDDESEKAEDSKGTLI